MAHVIVSRCVDVLHKGCARVCPVGAIHWEEGADRMLYVDPQECIDCQGCVRECPGGAILPPSALTAADAPWVEVNLLWFADRDAARAHVDALVPRRE